MCGQTDLRQGGVGTNAKVAGMMYGVILFRSPTILLKSRVGNTLESHLRYSAQLFRHGTSIPSPVSIPLLICSTNCGPAAGVENVYGPRVRLATHPTFKQLIEENGLELFLLSSVPSAPASVELQLAQEDGSNEEVAYGPRQSKRDEDGDENTELERTLAASIRRYAGEQFRGEEQLEAFTE
ncbi:predicted protein [Histoplasma capsulatum H143]|uniref:Uncharacterized protein n=1 Tax=Ajellomyces capsulatus (strain H143) TaxID=544712 RepID=C6HNF5_AJECH|nr:predicted protein [Histoplasma capsulatum H143]